MHKLLIILACVPITPIAVGMIALIRKLSNRHPEKGIQPVIVAASE